MLNIPDLSVLESWLNKKSISNYQCADGDALHLSHLKKMSDVLDAKVDLIDNIIYFSISSEIRSSAITPLLAELSQINASSSFVKAYLDIPDEDLAKIVFRHVIDCSEGITESQFSAFIKNVEEEALQIISELNHYELLSQPKLLADDLDECASYSGTYH